MKSFVNEYEEKLNDLCDKCKQMKQIFNKVLVSNKCDNWYVTLRGKIVNHYVVNAGTQNGLQGRCIQSSP